MAVTLTDRAVTKIKDIVDQDASVKEKALRVFVEQGGCSGFSYAFKFDDVKMGDDKKDYDGFQFVVDPTTMGMIDGAIIDYKEEFGQEGFAIQNPNAKKSCGCGNSFEV